jgi:hypothetical protein
MPPPCIPKSAGGHPLIGCCCPKDATGISSITLAVSYSGSGSACGGFAGSGSHSWTFSRINHDVAFDGSDQFKAYFADTPGAACCHPLQFVFNHTAHLPEDSGSMDPLDWQEQPNPTPPPPPPTTNVLDYNAYPLRLLVVTENADPCTGGTIQIRGTVGATDDFNNGIGCLDFCVCSVFDVLLATVAYGTGLDISALAGTYSCTNTCTSSGKSCTTTLTVTIG